MPIVVPTTEAKRIQYTGVPVNTSVNTILLTVAGFPNQTEGFIDGNGEIASYDPAIPATWAPNHEAGEIVLAEDSGATDLLFPVITYSVPSNFEYFSLTPDIIGTDTATHAQFFLQILRGIAGGMAKSPRFRYPDFIVGPEDLMLSFISAAKEFEKRISPTDSVLYEQYGPTDFLGTVAGIAILKSNGNLPPNRILVGQTGSTYFGISHIFGLTGPNMMWYTDGNAGIVEQVAGEQYNWKQLDVFATPKFPDFRNFQYYTIKIVP